MQPHLLLCIRARPILAERPDMTVMTGAAAAKLSAEIVIMSVDTGAVTLMIAAVMMKEVTAEVTDVTGALLQIVRTDALAAQTEMHEETEDVSMTAEMTNEAIETDVILTAEKEEERDEALATQTEETADIIQIGSTTGEEAVTADASEEREAITLRRFSAVHMA